MNPAQQETLELLTGRHERLSWASSFVADLKTDLDRRLWAIIEANEDDWPAGGLQLSKRDVAQLTGCSRRWHAEKAERDAGGFDWSVPKAKGSIVHKAVELAIMWKGEVFCDEVVEAAIDRTIDGERGLGSWLSVQDQEVKVELKAEANRMLSQFMETWPPLKREWRPVTEIPSRANLVGGRVSLFGKLDLTLGHAVGVTARKAVTDWKAGKPGPSDFDDLRFYALIDALKIGVPPHIMVSAYLTDGRLAVEQVTEATLEGQADRLVRAVGVWAAERFDGREPVEVASGACRWCPLQADCVTGTNYLAETRN